MIRGYGPQVQNSSIISTKNNYKIVDIRFTIFVSKNIHKIKFITVHTLFYKFNPSTYMVNFSSQTPPITPPTHPCMTVAG